MVDTATGLEQETSYFERVFQKGCDLLDQKIDRIETFQSNHADLARLYLHDGRTLMAKHYKDMDKRRPEGPSRKAICDPDALGMREHRSLVNIEHLVRPNLVPHSYGVHTNRVLYTEFIEGKCYGNLLDNYAKEYRNCKQDSHGKAFRLKKEARYVLYDLVEDVAKFNGWCTRRAKNLTDAFPEYERDHNSRFRLRLEGIEEILERHSNTRSTRARVKGEITKIQNWYEELGAKKVFSHGDLNPHHVIRVKADDPVNRSRFIDLEQFGIHYEGTDLSAALLYRPIGIATITRQIEFDHLMNRYLCFEHAARTGTDEDIQKLSSLKRENFVSHLEDNNIITVKEYARFYCSFFIESILKGIELQALDKNGEIKEKTLDELTQIFETIRGYQRLIEACKSQNSQENPARNILFTLGNAVRETRFAQLSNNFLEAIISPRPLEKIRGRELPNLTYE